MWRFVLATLTPVMIGSVLLAAVPESQAVTHIAGGFIGLAYIMMAVGLYCKWLAKRDETSHDDATRPECSKTCTCPHWYVCPLLNSPTFRMQRGQQL